MAWRSGGISELRRALTEPDYYDYHGVGPVDLLALLAQAAGVLVSGLGELRALRKTRRLPAEVVAADGLEQV